ncbi:hypothetical protein M8J76_015539 [Diaphorina citri]|nr:hypothetical protein M8J75_011209 [Diaphorina citri]KAI5714339.1 hypothetical protein M8J76_015539 [Diaphorina citri]
MFRQKRKIFRSSSIDLLDLALFDEEEYNNNEDIIYLKSNVSPEETVRAKWNHTWSPRQKKLTASSSDTSPLVSDLFKEFPALAPPLGCELLKDDFKCQYPVKVDNLFIKLNNKAEDIIQFARSRLSSSSRHSGSAGGIKLLLDQLESELSIADEKIFFNLAIIFWNRLFEELKQRQIHHHYN